jgi:hypothetical protein
MQGSRAPEKLFSSFGGIYCVTLTAQNWQGKRRLCMYVTDEKMVAENGGLKWGRVPRTRVSGTSELRVSAWQAGLKVRVEHGPLRCYDSDNGVRLGVTVRVTLAPGRTGAGPGAAACLSEHHDSHTAPRSVCSTRAAEAPSP